MKRGHQLVLFLFVCNSLVAQELIQTDYEKGYAKDGMKVSVWQYFDFNRQPELVINHTTGKLMFISKDTSDYFINNNDQWVASKLDIHPVPIEGSHNFYEKIKDKISYPVKDFKNGLEGKVVVFFEVDTLGNSTNYSIMKSIGGGCDSAVLQTLKTIDQKWVPAKVAGKKRSVRFAIDIEFRQRQNESPLEHEEFVIKNAKLLTQIIVARDERIFNFVEKSAEFPGGMVACYKWLSRNLHYPQGARRMGLEGRVTIKFIIEPDGTITNAEVLRGFDGACDKEALQLIQRMPKWIPGTQGGRPVRQAYVMPVGFKLSE